MSDNLLCPPSAGDFVRFDKGFGPRFLLTIDTEEEFDWTAPFDSRNKDVTTAEVLGRAQQFFAAFGIRPLYVADYPAIDSPQLGENLAQWAQEGLADVGAHCHPWVNPPYVEEVNNRNSFAGNLPEELERAKITVLRDKITEVTGSAPIAFRAGRYGAGPNTARILKDLGFLVDSSVRSRFDYSPDGGPDFTRMPVHPFYATADKGLIELPLSTAWVGAGRYFGRHLQSVIDGHKMVGGAISHMGILERIPLTPEGVTVDEAIIAIDRLLKDGSVLLLFSFHAPTLKPGKTPYVRNGKDVENFYHWWDGVLNHLARRSVTPVSLPDIVKAVQR